MKEPPFVVEVPSNRYFLDDHCANCLEPLPEDIETLFCSTWCNEISGAVRYQRGTFRDGRIDNPLVLEKIMVKNAFLLTGGYQALGRTLSTRARIEVKTRDNGKCQVCGKPGTDVDHIDGSSAELDNLQLLCAKCHQAKTAQSLVPATAEQRGQLLALHITRVMPDSPRLLADDQDEWQHSWRGLKNARKTRLLDELKAAGIETKGLKFQVEMLNVRDNLSSPSAHANSESGDEFPLPDWSWRSPGKLR